MRFFRGLFIALPISIVMWLILIKVCFGADAPCSTAGGGAGICYVDTASDGGDGTTTATTGAQAAFKTIAVVNGYTYAAGDQILFKRGGTWREQLTVPSSGSAGLPITFGAYGSGVNPIINGADLITGWATIPASQESGGIWHAGMETGLVTEWTDTSDSSQCTFTASATAKNNGSYGLLYTATGVSSYGNARKTLTTVTSGSVYFRYYFYIPTGALGVSKSVKFGQIYDSTFTHQRITHSIVTNGAGAMANKFGIYGQADFYTGVAGELSYDAWHYVELRVKIDGAVGGGEGWVDGVSKGSQYNLDTSTYAIDGVRLGPYLSGGVVNGGTIYMDDAKVSTSYLGAYSAPSYAYSVTLADDPGSVWFNGTHGTRKASVATLVSNNDFYYTGTTLSIYSDTDPAGKTIEGAIRSYGINIDAKNYITVQGITATHTKEWGSGIRTNGATYTVVDGCTLTENYYAGFNAQTTSGYATLSNNIISYNGSFGIRQGGSAGHNLITYNNIHHNVWRDVEGAPLLSNEADSDVVSYNTIYDNAAAADCPTNIGQNHSIYYGNVGNVNVEIHHNIVYNNGSASGIKLLGSGSIHHNISYNNYQAGIFTSYSDTGTTTKNIYYNICYGNYYGFAAFGITSGTHTLNIYNNTFYNNNNNASGNDYPNQLYIGDDHDVLNIKNNIVGVTSGTAFYGYWIANQTGTVSINNNILYTPVGGLIRYNGAARTWSTWQGYGFDTNGFNADPLFVNAAGGNFYLLPTSPARDAGVDVSLTIDYEGKAVPQGTAPDIGAYEFGPIGSPGRRIPGGMGVYHHEELRIPN